MYLLSCFFLPTSHLSHLAEPRLWASSSQAETSSEKSILIAVGLPRGCWLLAEPLSPCGGCHLFLTSSAAYDFHTEKSINSSSKDWFWEQIRSQGHRSSWKSPDMQIQATVLETILWLCIFGGTSVLVLHIKQCLKKSIMELIQVNKTSEWEINWETAYSVKERQSWQSQFTFHNLQPIGRVGWTLFYSFPLCASGPSPVYGWHRGFFKSEWHINRISAPHGTFISSEKRWALLISGNEKKQFYC